MKSVVYLLCGLGGSGKSTYAQKLTNDGLEKFSLDEFVYSKFGRGIVNLPEDVYLNTIGRQKLNWIINLPVL